MLVGNLTRQSRNLRCLQPHSKPPPNAENIKAAVAGSGTVMICTPHSTRVLSPPEETSAKKSVQVPFGSIPLKAPRLLERAAPLKAEPGDKGSSVLPSG